MAKGKGKKWKDPKIFARKTLRVWVVGQFDVAAALRRHW
jgi:head-tail adaptor